jgi:Co/Zn/Cd efflux system component
MADSCCSAKAPELERLARQAGQRRVLVTVLAINAVMLALGIGVIVNVIVKIQSGVPPSSTLMLVFGALALIANVACLRLLWRFRAQDVNMSSTFECSRNDVISNVGVLIAAGLVAATASPWPDIVIGSLMAALFLRSALRVIAQSLPELRAA